MGQKIHPKGFRLGIVYTWDSRWFAKPKEYRKLIVEDTLIRKKLLSRLQPAGIVRIEIERSINKINVILHVVRPGMVIGRGGQGLEELKKYISGIMLNRQRKVNTAKKPNFKLDLRVEPVKEPNLSAYFIAAQIAEQLAKRLPHKRVVKFALEKVLNE